MADIQSDPKDSIRANLITVNARQVIGRMIQVTETLEIPCTEC